MTQDMRGNIAAGALILGVAVASFATALSETGNLPLDKPEVAVSQSPTARPVVTPSPKHTANAHLEATISRKPISYSYAKADLKKWARQQLGDKQFSCVNHVWTNESDWDFEATNSQSGAYGIPQSLPAGKMASKGNDWKTNPYTQMKWGFDYIENRYGSPCNAWDHFKRNGWY
jgi:hypothetical protein